jgi:hypothetical protein
VAAGSWTESWFMVIGSVWLCGVRAAIAAPEYVGMSPVMVTLRAGSKAPAGTRRAPVQAWVSWHAPQSGPPSAGSATMAAWSTPSLGSAAYSAPGSWQVLQAVSPMYVCKNGRIGAPSAWQL